MVLYHIKGYKIKTKIFSGVQILAGLMLVVFGANKFLHFIPMGAPAPAMGAFMGALFGVGYLMSLVAVIEIAAGLSFLSNKFAPLMSVVLMPVMLNAFLAHLFLDPSGIGGALVLTLFTIIIMIRHREAYRLLLRA